MIETELIWCPKNSGRVVVREVCENDSGKTNCMLANVCIEYQKWKKEEDKGL